MNGITKAILIVGLPVAALIALVGFLEWIL